MWKVEEENYTISVAKTKALIRSASFFWYMQNGGFLIMRLVLY